MASNRDPTNNVKKSPIPVVPRTMKIVNPDGTPTRSGQLLLEQLQSIPAGTTGGGGGGGGAPGDVTGPVTGFTTAHEIGTRYTGTDRLVHLTVGFTPTMPTPQQVTYLISSDNGATWVWIGSQHMKTAGQELKVDRLAPGQNSTWKVAAVAGNLGGDPSPINDSDLDTLYPGVVRSAGFPVAGLAIPAAFTGITATIGSCTNQISADGFTQYGRIPGCSYTDPVGTTAFFVRITVQNLDASFNPLTAEQPYGGTQITGGVHTEGDLLITYIPNLAYERYRFYLANRNSQGEGDFSDPTTNTLQQVKYNGMSGTADHYDVTIVIPPFTPIDPGTAFNVTSVTASEVGPKYQDEKQGLHTVIGVIPVIDHDYSSPRTVTVWFDFGDGTPVWQGWYALTVAGEVVRIGDPTLGTDGVRKAGDIWVPANVSMGSWQVWCGAGRIDKGINPGAYVHYSFTVVPVQACSPTGTTGAQFVTNPATGDQIVYSKYDPGIWYWEYYELQWQPPTLAQEPNYWFTLITVQKGAIISGTWTPAPDAEGRNDDPTGQYVGRVHDEVVLAPGTDPTAVAIMKKFGSNPATWVIPPAQNPDLTTNVYRDFRFLLYNVSRLGTDASGSGGAGTYTLQTIAWPGNTDHYILTPVPQAAVLDIRAANPNTITLPLTGGNGQPLTVSANGITSGYIGPAAVTAANMAANSVTAANAALAANSVVNVNVHDVSVQKFTAGTCIFTGDVILSRGVGLPVIVLQNTGLTLFGQADASTGATGLTSKPYVQVQASGVKTSTGGTTGSPGQSVLIDAGTSTIWLYSRDGDTTFPYASVASNGLTLVNGPNSVAINTNAMSMTDTQFHNQLLMNSAGLTVSNTASNNRLVITSTAVQLQLAGYSAVTIDSTNGIILSNGGASSVQITASTVAITNGTFHYVTGGVTLDINPSISTLIGTANGMCISSAVSGTTYQIIMTSSGFTMVTSAGDEYSLSSQGFAFSGPTNGFAQHSGVRLSVQHLPSSNPGAGSGAFWYNPADSNRVYYQP
jgi:hypothetical protein